MEDQAADTALVRELLRRDGLAAHIDRVETLEEFAQALQQATYELILSDYSLPALDALEALRFARQHRPDIPFIFLSGTLGEEQAIDCLKLGATDYVLKHRLNRLVPAVRRALQETKELARRKMAEVELRQSEAKFRALFDHSPDAVFLTIPDGRITAANPAACALFGMTEAEILQVGRAGLVDPHDAARHALAVAERARTGRMHAELNYLRKNGERFTAEARSVVLGGEPLQSFVILRDITDRKQSEAALQRHAFHLQLLHQAAARLLVGQPPVELLRHLHPQIAQAFGADVFMLYQADPGDGHLHLQACAGVTAEEQHTLETLRYGRAVCAKPAEALQPIIATHLQTREAPNRRFVRKLGFRSYLYYPLILNHRLHGTVAFASRSRDDYDRTDLDFFHTIAGTLAEALERERLESELQSRAADLESTVQERTAKLQETIAELEQMSYSMIHDLRAPLRAIQSFGAIVATDPENRLSEESRELIGRMITATDRMDHLVRDVLNYGRVVREELPLGPVDVRALARGIVETYPELGASQAEVRVAPDLPVVVGNAAALTQCLSQLLDNAVKFAKLGQAPRIQIKGEPADRGSVRIVVEDEGVGIPPELQQRIFGMFQQLKNTGTGTGMGLAIVKKSVERMGGRVGVESEPGRGSRFWIELRAAAEPVAEPTQSLSE